MMQAAVSIKLFMGVVVTPELKMHLAHSHSWQEARIIDSQKGDLLHQIHFQNKEYIGLYADQASLQLPDVEQLKNNILSQLTDYCPKITKIENMAVYLFPQLFLT